jgi:hypothetical protein
VAAVLPKNLIGTHALSHLEWEPELNPDHPWRWHVRPSRRDDGAGGQEEIEEQIRLVFEGGHHGELNRLLAQALENPSPCRPLAGLHDVEAFAQIVGCNAAGGQAFEAALRRLGIERP